MNATSPITKVRFESYFLDDFTFENACTNLNPDIEQSIANSLQRVTHNTLRQSFISAINKDPKWTFIIPYMYSRITNSSTGPIEREGYYNYVLGYPKAQTTPKKLIMRFGYYDEDAIASLPQEKTSSTPQTRIGIKHMQLKCTDIDIVFSGVIRFKNNTISVSPMSGTWLQIMNEYVKDKPNLKQALNIMNIICTTYAIQQLLKQQNNEGEFGISECSETQFFCKYTKATGKPPQTKICRNFSCLLPNINIKTDLTCLKPYQDHQQFPTNLNNFPDADKFCFQDIPTILKNLST